MLAQRIGQRASAPQEHPAIPEIISRSHKCSCLLRVRLLSEAAHAKRVTAEGAARLNVAVAGFCAIGANAQDHDVFARSRDLSTALDRRAIALFIGDYVVGRKHSNHRIGMFAQEKKRGESDRGCGVPPYRLGKHLRLRQLRKLFQDRGTKIVVGNDPELLRRGQRQQPRHGLLDHGLLAVERQQLLGTFLPAQGPETRAAAAGEDYRIEV